MYEIEGVVPSRLIHRTGYNFRSLQDISPFLEPTGSGISALWARTTALRYDCAVIVGYPEKVDITAKWPTSPEYYNSALIVNGDGDTIANYRKSFLYYTDETWALEGEQGFYRGDIPSIGDVALGICMDLNPYKFEAPWDDFEFGFHVLDTEAKVVVLTMAWHTSQDTRLFSRRAQEPDLETLVYWVQRLEPLVRAELEDEVIVIFCNRTGVEDEVMYCGTSAVLGIRGGEVFVYGVLGRGTKELLVVDTSNPPICKLTDADGVETENAYLEETVADLDFEHKDHYYPSITDPTSQPPPQPHHLRLDTDIAEEVAFSPLSPLSPLRPNRKPGWLAHSDSQDDKTTNPLCSPTRLQIPTISDSGKPNTAIDSAVTDILIESPEAVMNHSSPLHGSTRPKLKIPASPWRFPKKPSPHPWHQLDGPQIFGGKVSMTPITTYENADILPSQLSPKSPQQPLHFWRPSQPNLHTPFEAIWEPTEGYDEARGDHPSSSSVERRSNYLLFSPESPKAFRNEMLQQPFSEHTKEEHDEERTHESPDDAEKVENWPEVSAILERLRTPAELDQKTPPWNDTTPQPEVEPAQSPCPDRPSSPKSRNASRNRRRSSLLQQAVDPVQRERESSVSRFSIPISASPSLFDGDLFRPQSIPISASPSVFAEQPSSSNAAVLAAAARPASRLAHKLVQRRRSASLVNLNLSVRSRSLSGAPEGNGQGVPGLRRRMRSASILGVCEGHVKTPGSTQTARRPRSLLRHEYSFSDSHDEGTQNESEASRTDRGDDQRDGGGNKTRPPRSVSRGRQPRARGTSVDRSNSVGETRSRASRRRSSVHMPLRPTASSLSLGQTPVFFDDGLFTGEDLRGLRVVTPRMGANNNSVVDGGGNNGGNADSDDEIIASIVRVAPDCPCHGVHSPPNRGGIGHRHNTASRSSNAGNSSRNRASAASSRAVSTSMGDSATIEATGVPTRNDLDGIATTEATSMMEPSIRTAPFRTFTRPSSLPQVLARREKHNHVNQQQYEFVQQQQQQQQQKQRHSLVTNFATTGLGSPGPLTGASSIVSSTSYTSYSMSEASSSSSALWSPGPLTGVSMSTAGNTSPGGPPTPRMFFNPKTPVAMVFGDEVRKKRNSDGKGKGFMVDDDDDDDDDDIIDDDVQVGIDEQVRVVGKDGGTAGVTEEGDEVTGTLPLVQI